MTINSLAAIKQDVILPISNPNCDTRHPCLLKEAVKKYISAVAYGVRFNTPVSCSI